MIKRNRKGQFVKGTTYVMSDIHKHKIGIVNKGENHGLWKGDNICYKTLHGWMRRNYKPTKCEQCGTKDVFIEWVLRGKKQSRDLKDWIQLCRSCHKRYDRIIYNIRRMRNAYTFF